MVNRPRVYLVKASTPGTALGCLYSCSSLLNVGLLTPEAYDVNDVSLLSKSRVRPFYSGFFLESGQLNKEHNPESLEPLQYNWVCCVKEEVNGKQEGIPLFLHFGFSCYPILLMFFPISSSTLRLNICVLLKSIRWNLTPNVTYLEVEPLGGS